MEKDSFDYQETRQMSFDKLLEDIHNSINTPR